MIIPLPQSQVHLTYCSNLHPIEKLDEVLAVAESFWPKIAEKLRSAYEPLSSGIDLGIWLSRLSSSDLLLDPASVDQLKGLLGKFDGQILTANAFPMGDFHQARVKEGVYLPDWQDSARLQYSKDVASLLSQLPHQGSYQSMSTSPGSFKNFPDVDIELIASNFVAMAQHLEQLEQETGRQIVLAIEPEPGCTFELTEELIEFYEEKLLRQHSGNEAAIRRHVGACFDCCHQAIQFEDPTVALKRLRSVGMKVSKVQLSSALEIDNPKDNREGLQFLSSFAEDRYLHQVVARDAHGQTHYFDDLPEYLAVAESRNDDSARVHFHVPIFLERIGSLGTTQADLKASLREIMLHEDCSHLEIETYSWGVMPERRDLVPTQDDLLNDVLAEYRWVYEQLT